MKKVLILLSFMLLAVSFIQCSGIQKPDPKVIACKAGCDATYDNCIKKAVNNEAKKAACEAVKNKCYRDCDK